MANFVPLLRAVAKVTRIWKFHLTYKEGEGCGRSVKIKTDQLLVLRSKGSRLEESRGRHPEGVENNKISE